MTSRGWSGAEPADVSEKSASRRYDNETMAAQCRFAATRLRADYFVSHPAVALRCTAGYSQVAAPRLQLGRFNGQRHDEFIEELLFA